MSSKFCAFCGSELQEEARFCSECGKPIGADKAPVKAPEDKATTASLASPEEPKPNAVEPDNQQIGGGQPQNKEQAPSQEQAPSADQDTDSGGGRTTASYARLPRVLTNPIAFVALYIVAIIPTYVLPYVGSNSIVANALGNAFAGAYPPSFWLHLAALFLAFVIAWFRGIYVNRAWIAILPFFATIFDMVTGFNWLFLVPTMFHIATMILGVSGKRSDNQVSKLQFNGSGAVLAVLCVMAVVANTKQQAAIEEKFIAPSKRSQTASQPSQSTAIAPPTISPNLKAATVVAMVEPPKTLTQIDECLLYKCSGARATAKRDLGIFSLPDTTSRRIGDLKAGEGFLLENGAWRTVAPRIIKVNNPTPADRTAIPQIQPGDVLYIYAGWGDGCTTTWLRGKLYGYFKEGNRPPGLKANIACLTIESEDVLTIDNGQSESWAKGKSDSGIIGWVRSDYDDTVRGWKDSTLDYIY